VYHLREFIALFCGDSVGREQDFITDRTRIIFFQNVARHVCTTSIRFPTISGFLDLSTDLWSRARRCVNEKKIVHGVTLAGNLWHFCHLGYRSCDKKTSLYRRAD